MNTNPYNMTRFQNKVALITGGASGIGRATTLRLAAEGAHVIIADKNGAMGQQTLQQIEATGGVGTLLEVDLADDASVQAAGATVAARFPALHLLVNNAAILRVGKIEDGAWLANWEIETRIGLRGWVLLTQVLLPLLKQEGGAIVNISSEGGFLGRQRQVVYDAIKAALVSVTKTMAQEFVEFFTKKGQTVLDPMAGTGSTLIAALRAGRNSYGIELNPKYAAIAQELLSQEKAVAQSPCQGVPRWASEMWA